MWSVLWMIIVYDSPETHPRISPKERDYIITEISAYQQDKISENRVIIYRFFKFFVKCTLIKGPFINDVTLKSPF